ncbi:MAG: tetratricopeptide repeat protein, partial [Tsuneonella sp.]
MKRRTAQHRYLPSMRAIALATLPMLLGAPAAQAQQTIARPVVQPLPPAASGDLSAALRRLAADSRDFQALIDAGKASLKLNDIDAALGFFGRADAVRPGDPQVKAGLAAAYLRSDRPLEALQLFAEADRGGAIDTQAMADRGLAYDLVGDNAAAQAQYRAALAHGLDTDTIMRLALSQAIAGDRAGFEATLLPLLQQRSLPAYRARAFGLAILGDEKEAVSIAQAVMPRDLADRVAPYLGSMPRLTHAQQAAAANLGMFPRAAQIGRDDPRIAA